MKILLIFSSRKHGRKTQFVVSEGQKFASLPRGRFSLAVILEYYTENLSPNVMSDTLLAHNLFHIGNTFLFLSLTLSDPFGLCNKLNVLMK